MTTRPTANPRSIRFVPFCVLLAACSASSAPAVDGAAPGSISDAGAAPSPDIDAAAANDATANDATPDAGALASCPTTGSGAMIAPGQCFAVTPADTGANASGQNALKPSYALTPAPNVAPRDALVVFLNGSGGTPAHAVATPDVNFYVAAASLGYSVIALSYRSDDSVGQLCAHDDACFFPTRESIIRGVLQPNASAGIANLRLDEGVIPRLALLLRHLRAEDPAHGWGSFLTSTAPDNAADTRIAWSKIVIAGHSQGGGHAAVIGKLFPVQRVVQLSAPCDNSGTAPASWTDGTAGTWASDPTLYYGLGAPSTLSGGQVVGDTTCPFHAVNWRHLGMSLSRAHDDAATCNVTGDTHSASLKCKDNYPAWISMLR